jgi:hypothetical protein
MASRSHSRKHPLSRYGVDVARIYVNQEGVPSSLDGSVYNHGHLTFLRCYEAGWLMDA